MRKILLFLLVFALFLNLAKSQKDSNIISEQDFITLSEYGKYLYENPRGISCKACHGEIGRGEIVAKYKKNDKEIELKAPNITTLSKEKFERALTYSKGIMPKYYLTKQEIDAIYSYIKSQDQPPELSQ